MNIVRVLVQALYLAFFCFNLNYIFLYLCDISIGGSKVARRMPPNPLGQNFFIFIQFLGKIGQITCQGLAHPHLGYPGSATDISIILQLPDFLVFSAKFMSDYDKHNMGNTSKEMVDRYANFVVGDLEKNRMNSVQFTKVKFDCFTIYVFLRKIWRT